MNQPIAEINKETFWALIAQAKEHPGGPGEWLMEQLMDLGPEQARRFDDFAHAYSSLADQYGLWTASLVDAPDYQDQRFDCLPHMGERAYEELTGRSTY